MKRYFLKYMQVLIVISCLFLAACDSSNPADSSQIFPEGGYPLMIKAKVDGMKFTRSTADGMWEGSELVAVKDVTGGGTDFGRVKEYKADASGVLSAEIPFVWQDAAEQKRIVAWYPYSEQPPRVWEVKSDQYADDGNGYSVSDLLYAPATDFTFDENRMTFYHQTARVVINILRLETVNEKELLGVTIGDETNPLLELKGTYACPEDGTTVGTWTLDKAHKGYIIPKQLSDPNIVSGNECVASFVALVIPQNMDGKRFIAVETSDKVYYYTPEAGDAVLEAGKEYKYTIVVKDPSLTVVPSVSASWNGESEDIPGIEEVG